MNLKFLYPLIGFAFGILISDFFPSFSLLGLICIGIAILIWLSLHIVSKNPLVGNRFSIFHKIWIAVLFMGIGSIDYQWQNITEIEEEIENKQLVFEGTIKKVNYLSGGDRFQVNVNRFYDNSKKYNCRNLNILLYSDGFLGSKGDIIRFEGNPHKFDNLKKYSGFADQMKHQGISYAINAKTDKINKIGESNSITHFFSQINEDIIILIEKSSLSRNAGDFLISLLMGDKSFLLNDIKQKITSAGLAHVLALSGLHVGIILSSFLLILFPLSLAGWHKSRRILALLLIWLYVLLTGMAPSTLRAALMATFVIGAIILERKNSALNSLLAATLIILFIDPWGIWNIGLQLSFICVASIILFVNRLNPIEHHSHPKTYGAVNLIIVTLVTTFASWTLVAYYFKSVPILFLPSNLILLPTLPLFLTAGMIYVALLILGWDFKILASIIDGYQDCFIKLSDFLSLNGDTVINIETSLLHIFLWLAGLILLGIGIHSISKRKKMLSYSFSALLLGVTFVMLFIPSKTDAGTIKFVHSFTKIEIHLKKDNAPIKFDFPRNKISEVENDNYYILSIDQPVITKNLDTLIEDKQRKKCYLMVGPGAEINQISEIINAGDFSHVILHSGIGKNKKTDMLRLIDDSQLHKIYSLRENGSLELDL